MQDLQSKCLQILHKCLYIIIIITCMTPIEIPTTPTI